MYFIWLPLSLARPTLFNAFAEKFQFYYISQIATKPFRIYTLPKTIRIFFNMEWSGNFFIIYTLYSQNSTIQQSMGWLVASTSDEWYNLEPNSFRRYVFCTHFISCVFGGRHRYLWLVLCALCLVSFFITFDPRLYDYMTIWLYVWLNGWMAVQMNGWMCVWFCFMRRTLLWIFCIGKICMLRASWKRLPDAKPVSSLGIRWAFAIARMPKVRQRFPVQLVALVWMRDRNLIQNVIVVGWYCYWNYCYHSVISVAI